MKKNKKKDKCAPPCGIFCPQCPRFGAKNCKGCNCRIRRCGIYKCCVEKKELKFCFQCKSFPCYRLKKFTETWKKHGADLIQNQKEIKKLGTKKWITTKLKDFE